MTTAMATMLTTTMTDEHKHDKDNNKQKLHCGP
jgi:hypothetical protein